MDSKGITFEVVPPTPELVIPSPHSDPDGTPLLPVAKNDGPRKARGSTSKRARAHTVVGPDRLHMDRAYFIQAANHVEDAFNGESTVGQIKNDFQLKVFEWHGKLWWLRMACMVLFLALPIFETPVWCLHAPSCGSDSVYLSSKSPKLPPWAMYLMEILCLVTFFIALAGEVYYDGIRLAIKERTPVVRAVLILASLIDCILSASGVPYTFYVASLCRGFIFGSTVSVVRRFLVSAGKASKGAGYILFQVTVVVLLFGWLGTLLFSDHNPFYKTMYDGIINTHILLTTANFPDIMLPSYEKSRFSALFFLIFLILCLYLLMALVLAYVYNSFKEQMKKNHDAFMKNRRSALLAAFRTLDIKKEGTLTIDVVRRLFRRLNAHSDVGCVDMNGFERAFLELDSSGDGLLDSNEFLHLCNVLQMKFEALDPDGDGVASKKPVLPDEELKRMSEDPAIMQSIIHIQKTFRGHLARKRFEAAKAKKRGDPVPVHVPPPQPKQVRAPAKLDKWEPLVITHTAKAKKKAVVRHVKPEPETPAGPAQGSALALSAGMAMGAADPLAASDPIQRRRLADIMLVSRRTNTWFDRMWAKWTSTRPYRINRAIVLHWGFARAIDLLVVANMVLLIIQSIAEESGDKSSVTIFSVLGWIILGIFLWEVAVKLLAMRWRAYWAEMTNRFDFLITFLSLFLEILGEFNLVNREVSRVILIGRCLRLLRLMLRLKGFRVLFKTYARLLPALGAIAGMVLSAYYVFNALGIALFGGKIYRGARSLAGTAYAEMGYEINNFNDFNAGIVTLFELMVVNNWFVNVEGFVAATSEWARIYFITWWLVAVVFLANLMVAFVLEAFQAEFSTDDAMDDVDEGLRIRKIKKGQDFIFSLFFGEDNDDLVFKDPDVKND